MARWGISRRALRGRRAVRVFDGKGRRILITRKRLVTMVSGGKFDLVARRIYSTCRDRVPDALLSAESAKGRAYDRLTIEIARQALCGGGNSIDVGAHDGGILKQLIKLSGKGRHWAFEPIPSLAQQLQRKYPDVSVEQVALADYDGWADFNYIPGAAAYSTLLPHVRPDVSQFGVKQLRVRVRRLDDCIPADVPIAFIKIDVEGGEPATLRGAVNTLKAHRPVVVFECASAKLAECIPPLEEAGLHVSLLADHLACTRRSSSEVMKIGRERGEFYYVASR